MTENTRYVRFTKKSAEALLSAYFGPLSGHDWLALEEQYCGDDTSVISKLFDHFDVPMRRLGKAICYLSSLSTGLYEVAEQFGEVPADYRATWL